MIENVEGGPYAPSVRIRVKVINWMIDKQMLNVFREKQMKCVLIYILMVIYLSPQNIIEKVR